MSNKLEKVLIARDAEIEVAAHEVQRVDDAVTQRRRRVEALQLELARVDEKILRLTERTRTSALRTGDADVVSMSTRYLRKLSAEKKAIHAVLQGGIQDLERALQRDRVARDELVDARVEKRKVEHLLNSASIRSRLTEEAIEEQSNDEIFGQWDNRGWPKK